MFDMSWGEMMVIGGVALIVIGPKELPKALRTLGRMTTKVRRMAGEFHGQFQEAMREAELEDVRKEVEGLNRQVSTASTFDPIGTIRNELKSSIESPTPPQAALPAGGDWAAGQSELTATPVDGGSAGSGANPGAAGSGPLGDAAGPPSAADPGPSPEPAVAIPEIQPLVPLPAEEPVRLEHEPAAPAAAAPGSPEPVRP